MVTATQANRRARIETPFGPDGLLLKELVDVSRLSQPFRIDLSLLSEQGDLDPDKILGKSVTIELDLADGSTRYFNGLVAEFAQTGYEEVYHEYQAVVRPWFWFLTRAADCRIFHDKSVPDIFKAVIGERGFSDLTLKLDRQYSPVHFCVQYRETDFNFLSRLLEREGIYYFFEHSAQKHEMVLIDDVTKHATRSGYETVPYYPPATTRAQRLRDHLSAFTVRASVQPGTFATTDYDCLKPNAKLDGTYSIPAKHTHGDLQIFDYPAELDPSDGASAADRVARTRAEELKATAVVAEARGDAAGLVTGVKFKLDNHPRDDFNKDYVIVASTCSVASDAYRTGADEATLDCNVSIEAIAATVPYRPPRLTPKPVIQGAQTAKVVGAQGSEIDTDDHGRVLVRFHWDRENRYSCRLRVAQVWAGDKWGGIHIPRVGQEVIVHFLEGDPDRPIITGRVYNAALKPPYDLPGSKNQSGIKSRSTTKGGADNFNELRFDDTKGNEELFVQAEKNLTLNVKNDAKRDIGHDRKTTIKNDETLEVGRDRKETIKANDTLDVGKTLKIKAGDEITLETGQSKIVMKKDGSVTITCMKLKIDATQELKASSMQVKVDGQVKVAIASGVQLELKGTMTKVEGSGMLDLAASGMAKLKGSLTMIG